MHPLHQQHVGSAHSVNPGSDYYRPPHPDNPCYPPFSTASGQSNRSDAHPPSHGHASAGSSTQYPLHPSFHGHDVGSHHLSSSHNHQAAAGGLTVARFRFVPISSYTEVLSNVFSSFQLQLPLTMQLCAMVPMGLIILESQTLPPVILPAVILTHREFITRGLGRIPILLTDGSISKFVLPKKEYISRSC